MLLLRSLRGTRFFAIAQNDKVAGLALSFRPGATRSRPRVGAPTRGVIAPRAVSCRKPAMAGIPAGSGEVERMQSESDGARIWMPFTGNPLDRASNQRHDDAW